VHTTLYIDRYTTRCQPVPAHSASLEAAEHADHGMKPVYGSDPFGYDLNAALKDRGGARVCRFRDLLELVELNGRRLPLPTPTREELLRHSQRHGSQCVAETAAEYGSTLGLALEELAFRQEQAEIERRHANNPSLREAKLKSAARRARHTLRGPAIEALLDGSKSVGQVAAELAVREQTVRGWLRR